MITMNYPELTYRALMPNEYLPNAMDGNWFPAFRVHRKGFEHVLNVCWTLMQNREKIEEACKSFVKYNPDGMDRETLHKHSAEHDRSSCLILDNFGEKLEFDLRLGSCCHMNLSAGLGIQLKACLFRKFTSHELPSIDGYRNMQWYNFPVDGCDKYYDEGKEGTLWLNPRRWELVEFMYYELLKIRNDTINQVQLNNVAHLVAMDGEATRIVDTSLQGRK